MYQDRAASLQSELSSGEVLLWAGQPRQGVYLTASDLFLVPFSLLWGGFAIFWEVSVIATGAPFFFKLWGIPFVLIGLYMIAGRFFFDARQRAGICYGVTSERVLIVTVWPTRNVKSLWLRTLSEITLKQGSSGVGTIVFGPASPFPQWNGSSSWPASRSAPSFESVAEAKEVYDMIRSSHQKFA